MKVNEVSEESLQKAMQALNLTKAEEVAEVVNTEEEEEEEEEEGAEEGVDDELVKAEKELGELQAKVEQMKKAKNTPVAVVDQTELIKGFDEKFTALGTLIQSKDEQIAELRKAVDQVNKFNEELSKKLGMIERTPMSRKSVTTTSYIEKGGEGSTMNGSRNEAKRTMSISDRRDRAEIADILFKAATVNEKPDAELSKAVSYVELGQIPAPLQKRLYNEFNINVVK